MTEIGNSSKMLPEFFDFWDKIDFVKEIEHHKFNLLQETVRNLIIQALNDGIEGIHPITGKSEKRRALNASEIRQSVNEKYKKIRNKMIGKANLFFHLNKLINADDEDAGFIKIVGYIDQGRRRTAYYGRTAKAFFPIYKTEEAYFSFIQENDFKKLIQRLNPNMDLHNIESLLGELGFLDKIVISEFFKNWSIKFQNEFKGLNIEFPKLLSLINTIYQFNSKSIQALSVLAEMLHLDFA
ncbi:MAG: hypothetical protein ACXAD7_18525, partial [Candidatus Kariarchaeaceae archaeon]